MACPCPIMVKCGSLEKIVVSECPCGSNRVKIPQVSCWTVRDCVCNEAIREQLTIANILDFEKYRRLWKGQRIIDYQWTPQYNTVQTSGRTISWETWMKVIWSAVISEQAPVILKDDNDSSGNDDNDNLVAGISPDFCFAKICCLQ